MGCVIGIFLLVVFVGPFLLVALILSAFSSGSGNHINTDNSLYPYYDDPYYPVPLGDTLEHRRQIQNFEEMDDYYSHFYDRLDDEDFDEDPEILKEEDPEMFHELYGDEEDF